jgi:hypothetical protein
MTQAEATELKDFIEGLCGCESVSLRRRRLGGSGYAITVRMVDTPPRTYASHARAFAAYCAGGED